MRYQDEEEVGGWKASGSDQANPKESPQDQAKMAANPEVWEAERDSKVV